MEKHEHFDSTIALQHKFLLRHPELKPEEWILEHSAEVRDFLNKNPAATVEDLEDKFLH